jgi:hypothetical protein
LGCASGKNAGPRNIFGNKYGQNLAAVQIAREHRMALKQQREAARRAMEQAAMMAKEQQASNNDDDAETDDENDDDDDYGPSPAAGIWAGSKKLEQESEHIADPDGDAETDDEEEDRPAKKVRIGGE